MNIEISKKENFFSILILILLSLFLSISYSIEQYAIYPALSISGQITYPEDFNIFFLQSKNSWSFITQFIQFILKFTTDLKLISIILLFFSSLCYSIGVYFTIRNIALSNILALATTFFIMFFRKNFGDIDYPTLMFSEHTNGMMSLAIVTLIFGLIINRNFFFSGFFSIFLICVHVTLGLWINSILVISILYFFYIKKKNINYKSIFPGIIFGLIIVLISFTVYKVNIVEIPFNFNQSTYDNYLNNWDAHRQSYGQLHLLNIEYIIKSFLLFFLIVISVPLFNYNNNEKYIQIYFTFIFISFNIILSFLLYISYKKFPFIYPEMIVRVIPTRFFLTQSVIGYPIIISLIFLFWYKILGHKKKNLLNYFFLLLILAYSISHHKNVSQIYLNFVKNIKIEKKPSNEEIFWGKIKNIESNGYIVTSEKTCYSTHAKALKPIILCPHSIDYIPYIPKLAEPTKQILEEIYGTSFNKPPPKLKIGAIDGLRDFAIKFIFEKKTFDEWNILSKKYNIQGLIVPSNWEISFEPNIKSKKYSYYKLKNN